MNNKIKNIPTSPYIPDFTQHELLSAYHDGLSQSVEFAQKEIIPVLNGQLNFKQVEEAILGLFYLAHSLASSGTRLNNKLDFVAVAGNARTLFELLLDMKILCAPNLPQQTLDQFGAFAQVDRFKKARKLVELQKKNLGLDKNSFFDAKTRKEFVDTPGKVATIERKVESLWGRDAKGKLRWPHHWSGLSVADRSKRFGPIYEQEYLEIYSLLCSYAHSGNSAYANLSDSALESLYGIALKLTRQIYLEVLLIVAKIFSLSKSIDSFTKIVRYLEDAPKHILLEYGLEKIRRKKQE